MQPKGASNGRTLPDELSLLPRVPRVGIRRQLFPMVMAIGVLLGAAACSSGGSSRATKVPPTSLRPTTTTTVTSPPTTAPPTTAPPVSVPAGSPPLATEAGDLQPGVKGLRTLALQQKLNDLRFDVGKPDGSFGQMTVMAVWAWQAAHGQPANGVVTPVQYVQIMGSGPLAMLHPEAGPDHVEVDLDRQILLEFRSGQLDLVTHVSTGSGRSYCERDPRNGQRNCGDAQTPPGLFAFGRRASGWEIGPLGGLYNPVYFNRGIAVHGAPSVPNHPASHGCVRIPMHIAEYFPGRVTTGEPVLVFHGGQGPLATASSAPPPTVPSAPTSPVTVAPPTSAPTVTTPASTASAPPVTSVAPPVSFG